MKPYQNITPVAGRLDTNPIRSTAKRARDHARYPWCAPIILNREKQTVGEQDDWGHCGHFQPRFRAKKVGKACF